METTVLIIGGGVTGAGLVRDLSMRGIRCILVEKNDVNAGASGGNHGLLHSGARYIADDPEAARECRDEGGLLKRLAPHCIEDTGGLFVAVQGDDEKYIAEFPTLCARSGVAARAVDREQAREFEPCLSPKMVAAYAVDDAAIDPFRLSLDNIAHAVSLGATFLPKTKVVSFTLAKGKISRTRVKNTATGDEFDIHAEQVINASGAWSGMLAALAGLNIDLVCSKGTLLVTQNRIAGRVINRLRPATDGDILVPGGTVSILGTTSVRLSHPDQSRPTIPEVDQVIDEGKAMIPELEKTRYIRAYAGVRPLFGTDSTDTDRDVSRGFALLDHERDGLANFTTITGGKLTTFRLMAEKAADLVCAKLGVSAPCRTTTEPLPSFSSMRWTEPGRAPKEWFLKNDPNDQIICECEMVPTSAVDQILESLGKLPQGATLLSLGLRSRIGKGPCQGGLCSLRLAAYLYNKGRFCGDQGVEEIKNFLNERWRGVHPLLWDVAAQQAEFQEALHCGFFGLEQAGTGGEE